MELEAPVEVSQSRIKTRVPLCIEENLAGVILGVLALLTFANVVVRYFTSFSFASTEEFSIFFMVVMTFLGSSSLMAKGGHLNISFVVDRLPEKYGHTVRLASMALTALTYFMLTVLAARMAWDEYRFEVTSPGLGVPTWIYTVWLPILSLAITGRAVGKLIRMSRGED